MKINILGSEWNIVFCKLEDDKALNDADGYCDWTIKRIVVRKEIDGSLHDMDAYTRKVIRHEIVHAFLFESGLAHCSNDVSQWATNEEMIDWFAFKGEQIYKAWKDARAVEILEDADDA